MKRGRCLPSTLVFLVILTIGTSQGAAAPEGQMTWGLHFSPTPGWFDPTELAGTVTSYHTLYALHDAMIRPSPDQPMSPSLAESWSASPDGLVYEFVLRKGVKFHNGDSVSAEDVKFSFERYRGNAHKMLKEKVASIEIPDPARVRFRLKQPWPDFMTFYSSATGAGWVVPKKYHEKVGDDGFKKAPIGAGPYRFVSFTPGVELVVEAFDQYWRKVPSVKRLVFKSIPDESTRLAALKRGEVDIAYGMSGALAEELRRTPGLRLKPVAGQVVDWVNFTEQWDAKSPWHDQRVRLAATHAIDRQAMNQAERLGFARVTWSLVPPSFEFYWQPPGYSYDPVKARRLLAEAGYPNGFDTGDYFCDAALTYMGEPVVNYLNAIGHSRQAAPHRASGIPEGLDREEIPWTRSGRQRLLRKRRHQARIPGDWWRHVRLRQLRGRRRALPGAGRRAGSQEARGSPASRPATDLREGRGRAYLAERSAERRRTEGRGVGDRARRRLHLLGAVRGREAQK